MEAGSQDGQALEKLMDEYLESKGFYRKKIAKDGSCLFRAVAEQVLYCQSRHTEVRAACVSYLRKNRTKYEAFVEGNFAEYLEHLQDPQNWVGEVEISALALIYKHDFIIFQEPGKPPVHITENGFPDQVRLCFLNGNHYDSVYPKEFESKAALCQSILYELLYKRVCSMDGDLVDACLKGCAVTGRDIGGECRSSEESDLDEDSALGSSEVADYSSVNSLRSANSTGSPKVQTPAKSHLPQALSLSARKSLCPFVFRNVAYDVWLRSQRAQQKRDFRIAAGMQYAVGDKCKARLENSGRFYSAYVQEVSPNNGPVMVFIEELGKKHSVPLCNLRASTDEALTWSTVAEKGRKQSFPDGNGHRSEWESRTRRSAKAPSPAARTPAQGRIQKQDSWPSQVLPEEAPSSRTSNPRKGDLRTAAAPPQDAHSGALSEEQALLEIMQRDEKSFPALRTAANSNGHGKKAGAQLGESGKRAGSHPGDRRGSRKKGDLQEQSWESERKSLSPKTGMKGEKSKGMASAQSSSSLKLQSSISASDQSPAPAPSTPISQTSQATGPVTPSSQPSQAPSPATSAPTQTTQGTRPPTASLNQLYQAPGPAARAPVPTSPASGLISTSAPTQSVQASCLVSTSAATQPSPVTDLVSTATPIQLSQGPCIISTSAPIHPSQAPVLDASSTTNQPSQAPSLIPTSVPPQPSPALDLISTSPPTQTSVALGLGTPGFDQSSKAHTTFGSVLVQPPQTHGPSQVAFLPPSTPPSQIPLPPCVIPNPPPQKGPVPPSGFSSLPLEPPPYEVATSCPLGVMSQVRISPGPTTIPMLPEQLPHSHGPHSSAAHGPIAQAPIPPLHQFPSPYQDPLYPGFPVNEKEEVEMVPPFSLMCNGDDLPRDTNVLRFFYNLGIKAYTYPMWMPHSYIYPLYQAYLNACAMQPKPPPLPQSPYMTPWMADAPAPVLHMNSVQEAYGQVPFSQASGRSLGPVEPLHCPVHPGAGMGMEVPPPRHPELCLGSEGRPALGYSPQSALQLPPRMGSIPWARQALFTPQFPPQFLASSPYPTILPGYPVQRLPSANPSRPELASTAEPPVAKMVNQSGNDGTGTSIPTSGVEQSMEQTATPTADTSSQASVLADPGLSHESHVAGEPDQAVSRATPDTATPEKDHALGEVSLGPGVDCVPGTTAESPQGSARSAYGAVYPRREEGDSDGLALRNGRSYYGTHYRGRRGYDDGQGYGRERGWRGRGAYRSRRVLDNRREYGYKERRPGETYPTANDKGQSRGRGRAYVQYHGSREAGYSSDGQRHLTYSNP
ncbi:OTU domain-containing protein 4 [Brienomyrus brachyistius]|uniref:OTU domain-containing protein 4 n=1 Tax=Brienomyrus brachyistius TaxID=42636 RepID=UPI0020B18DCD|nr:OTU domain-containing protein 4 [Brienomyrus brachyistius]